jgi:hypothetical protein
MRVNFCWVKTVGNIMRKIAPFWAAMFAVASLWAGAASADGGKNTGAFVARPPSGPTDSRLVGKESAPSASPATQSPGSPSKMDAAPAMNPPAAPQAVEDATPTPPMQSTQAASAPVVETQSVDGSSTPFWENRWFWALLALLLLLSAGAVEYFGRKRDERLAAEEPDDAVRA